MEQLPLHGVPLGGAEFLRRQIRVQQEAFDHIIAGILSVPLVQPSQKEQLFLHRQAVGKGFPGFRQHTMLFHRVGFLPGGIQNRAKLLGHLFFF